MALRPGQSDWETEMWADALVTYLADGMPAHSHNELLSREGMTSNYMHAEA